MDVSNFFGTRFPVVKMETEESLGEKFKDPTQSPLEMEKLEVRLNIHQNVVRSTHLMTFCNKLDRKLKGELCFPLPPDGTVHGYGLDVNGVIIDAVPVEKKRSRVAFETEVREQGSSVAVAEKIDAGSNIWKLKVYPIPPNGRRMVKVVVHSPCLDEEEHKVALVGLSMPESLKEFTFSCGVSCAKVFIKTSSGERKLVKPEDITADEDVEGIMVISPKKETKKVQIHLEKDPDCGYHYFSATFSNLSFEGEGKNVPTEVNNKLLSVYYDVSSSRISCDREKEIEAIECFMKENEECEEIEVTTFSCYLHEVKKRFKKENISSLYEFIRSQEFDGGTLIPIYEIFQEGIRNPTFLFSDGMSNFGKEMESELLRVESDQKRIIGPLYCFSSSTNANFLFLRHISEVLSNCGLFIDLLNNTDGNEDYYDFNRKGRVTVTNIVFEPPSAMDEIYPHHQPSSCTIYGRILEPEKEPTIRLEFSNGKVVETKIPLDLYKENIDKKNETLIRTLWAQKRIDKLSLFSSKNKDKIEDLGLKYGIVTEHTSLLVLTELEQFLKYKVAPPKSLKEMRKKYLNEIQSEVEIEESRKSKKIEEVYKKWESKRVRWHQRDFMKELEEKKRKKAEEEEEAKKRQDQQQQQQGVGISGKHITLTEGFSHPVRERVPGGKDNVRNTLPKQVVILTRPPPMDKRNLSCECVLIGRELRTVLSTRKFGGENNMASFEDELIVRRSSHSNGINGKLFLRFNLVEDSSKEVLDSIDSHGFMTITRRGMEKQRGRRRRNVMPSLSLSSLETGINGLLFEENQLNVDFGSVLSNMDTFGGDIGNIESNEGKESGSTTTTTTTSSIASENVIRVKAFEPGEKYMEVIRESKNPYQKYLQLKKETYRNSPSFYLDVSDYFLSRSNNSNNNKEEEVEGEIDDLHQRIGIRILSNICELELNNVQLNRIVGYRLDQANMLSEARHLFEKVLREQEDEEPQSYRDLALVLEKMGHLEKSASYLWKVVTMKIDPRFDEIELIAAVELNHVLFQIHGNQQEVVKRLGIDDRFLYPMDCDIRISMGWDSDMTDIDLHVYDPNNEHCFYSNKQTKTGGFISRDFTKGYGPEEFMQKVAVKGKYRITAKFFASHRQDLCGGTTILLNIYTNYLREEEKREMVTLRLNKNKEEVEVCEMEFYKKK